MLLLLVGPHSFGPCFSKLVAPARGLQMDEGEKRHAIYSCRRVVLRGERSGRWRRPEVPHDDVGLQHAGISRRYGVDLVVCMCNIARTMASHAMDRPLHCIRHVRVTRTPASPTSAIAGVLRHPPVSLLYLRVSLSLTCAGEETGNIPNESSLRVLCFRWAMQGTIRYGTVTSSLLPSLFFWARPPPLGHSARPAWGLARRDVAGGRGEGVDGVISVSRGGRWR
jgi:hypothetical protein